MDVKDGEVIAASTNVKSLPVLEATGATTSLIEACIEELVGMLNEAVVGIIKVEGPAKPVVIKFCEAEVEAKACEVKVCEAAAGVVKTISCRPVIIRS
jgi:hypothetical protein